MHFFRSEEHLRSWHGFQEKKKGGIISLSSLMELFSGPYFTKRRDPDYFSHIGEYLGDMVTAVDSLGNAGAYWRVRPLERLGFSLGAKLGLI